MNDTIDIENEFPIAKSVIDLPPEILAVNESEMTDQAVHYLIDEVLKKKKELHDPKHRCNRFFGEIRDILMDQYGLFFSIRTLERKYHYLKRHFDTLCQSNGRNNVESKLIKSWPYFDKMMEIFSEELDIEDAPTMASLYPDLPLPKSALPVTVGIKKISTKNLESNDVEIRETIWSHSVVLDLLNICVEKKDDFWNLGLRRCDILSDIQSKMKAKGHTFKLESLDRKLKNLKTCYHTTVEGMRKRSNLKNRAGWPYFTLLDKLYNGFNEYRDERRRMGLKRVLSNNTKVCRQTGLSQPMIPPSQIQNCNEHLSSTKTKFIPIRCKPESFDVVEVSTLNSIDRSNSCSLGDFDSFMEVDAIQTDEDLLKETAESTNNTPNNNVADDMLFTQKMLNLEERRTIATEQLLVQLQDSNRIRQRKIEFNRQKLAYLKFKVKRKELLRQKKQINS